MGEIEAARFAGMMAAKKELIGAAATAASRLWADYGLPLSIGAGGDLRQLRCVTGIQYQPIDAVALASSVESAPFSRPSFRKPRSLYFAHEPLRLSSARQGLRLS